MANQDDSLFLLEVLVDKIIYSKSPCFSDKAFRTCVIVKCLSCDPLELCDDDTSGSRHGLDDSPFMKSFNTGKSCLFSLKQEDIASAMSKFEINVSVFKELPCGCLPIKINLGVATIDMTKEFVQTRNSFIEDPNHISYQALKDSFHLKGADGVETGEILMFLRISCFGKLIVTKFRGGGGPPKLGSGIGGVENVDRSCNPARPTQSVGDPCACGAARASGAAGTSHGSAGNVCSPARDPYNSKPCEEPDDPCYCTGPKAEPKQQMACRNTEKYCLHVPKGTPTSTLRPSLPSEEQRLMMFEVPNSPLDLINQFIFSCSLNPKMETFVLKDVYHQNSLSSTNKTSSITLCPRTSISTIRSRRDSVCFANNVKYHWKKNSETNFYVENIPGSVYRPIYGKQLTAVYMTLYDQFCRHRTSGTQATASINKSFQVSTEQAGIQYPLSSSDNYSKYNSPSTKSYIPYCNINKKEHLRKINYSETYFFSKKNNGPKTANGEKELHAIHKSTKSVQVRSNKQSTPAQTDKHEATSAHTNRHPTSSYAGTALSKAVSIKEPDKQKANDRENNNDSLMATVSHIRIGPRQSCPIYGSNPCLGPNCISMGLGPGALTNVMTLNSDNSQQKVPIKVSTTNNPRRGVFELVIRRIDGALLAKNELFLEWTPPPGKPASCCLPYPLICSRPGSCRPPKCKIPVCRPLKPKCCKKPLRCKFPCGPKTSCCGPCGLCGRVSCPGSPAYPCWRPCPPKPCRPLPCRPKPRVKPYKTCKPCKPCKPCSPAFPFKRSCTSCNVCCSSIVPCPKPVCCGSCRPWKPCKRCKPCKSCFPYRPCVPDLACPKSKTSIVFKSCKSKHCNPCLPCSDCPFPTCYSCFPCITSLTRLPFGSSATSLFNPPCKPCISFYASDTCISATALVPCKPYVPREQCDAYDNPSTSNVPIMICNPSSEFKAPKICKPCISYNPCKQCEYGIPFKSYKIGRKPCSGKCCKSCNPCKPCKRVL